MESSIIGYTFQFEASYLREKNGFNTFETSCSHAPIIPYFFVEPVLSFRSYYDLDTSKIDFFS